MDRRLQRRYVKLVKEHLHSASSAANGLTALPGVAKAFASTQAAWRFYANPRVTLPRLVEPLLELARHSATSSPADTLLVVHDWSMLNFPTHTSKQDRAELTHDADIGYELATALVVDAASGDPIAPLEMRLSTAEAVHSTREPAPSLKALRLDQVLPTLQASQGWGLGKPLVHIIDREADSVGHYRNWAAAGHRFLVRADDRRVLWNGRETTLRNVVKALRRQGMFRFARDVEVRGQSGRQLVAETTVVLHRPARRNTGRGKKVNIPGPPLELRLVVSHVEDSSGRCMACWMLLTNAPLEVPAATIALWYYWRWRIESYFKLLKSFGQCLEDWRQEDGAAIAKRLLIASMACVVVWLLISLTSPEAHALRLLLVQLSGRQMKRGRAYTAPALLAGFQSLVAMLHVLEHYELSQIRHYLHRTLPFLLDTG